MVVSVNLSGWEVAVFASLPIIRHRGCGANNGGQQDWCLNGSHDCWVLGRGRV